MSNNEIIGSVSHSFPFLVVNANAPLLYCQFDMEVTDYSQSPAAALITYHIFRIRIIDPRYVFPAIFHADLYGTGETGAILIPVSIRRQIELRPDNSGTPSLSREKYAEQLDALAARAFDTEQAAEGRKIRMLQQNMLAQAMPAAFLPLYQEVTEYLAGNWTQNKTAKEWYYATLEDGFHPITQEEYELMTEAPSFTEGLFPS